MGKKVAASITERRSDRNGSLPALDATGLTRSIAPLFRMRTALLPVFVCVAVFLSGCAGDPRFDRMTEYLGQAGNIITRFDQGFDNVSYWDGDGVHGSPRIVIRLSEQ